VNAADVQAAEHRTASAAGPGALRRPAGPGRLAFWRGYLTTMRPYLFPVSALAGLAGMSLADALDPWRWGLALGAFTLSYGFGQALTDCFQQDTDRLSAPCRPLVRGTISARGVLAASLAGMAGGAGILVWCNPWNLAVAALTVLGLLAYTPLKRRWYAGPIANAWVVSLLPIMGWFAASGGTPGRMLQRPEVLVTVLLSFTAYANFVVVGYLKDVDADRRTRYNTFPVVFGWRRTALLSDLWAVSALAAGICAVALTASGGGWATFVAAALILAAAAFSIAGQTVLHRTRQADQAYRPILHTVRVFLLLHAAVVIAASPRLWPAAAIFCLAFEFLAFFRPERRQV